MAPEYLTIAEAARLIAAKELSPVELIDSRLQRIERLDSRLNSFIRVLAMRRVPPPALLRPRSLPATTAGRCMASQRPQGHL